MAKYANEPIAVTSNEQGTDIFPPRTVGSDNAAEPAEKNPRQDGGQGQKEGTDSNSTRSQIGARKMGGETTLKFSGEEQKTGGMWKVTGVREEK